MKRTLMMIAASLVLFAGSAQAAPLKVVTTISDIASLTNEVGGDRVDVTAIARGYQDPHFVEPKPSFLLLLRNECNAKVVFLVDKNGQQIAANGELNSIDTTALASLAAGNVAATDSLARLIGEKEFSVLFHEGERDNLHISVVGGRVILVVIFDERSSLGLVRLRVKKGSTELAAILDVMLKKSAQPRKAAAGGSPFAEITDEDIDKLFSD